MVPLVILLLLSAVSCQAVCTASDRNYNGTCNSLSVPNLGASGSLLISPEGVEFLDGISKMVRRNNSLTNERILSNVFLASDPYPGLNSVNITAEQRQTGQNPDSRKLNNLFVMFSQFVSHDLSLTPLIFTGEGFAGIGNTPRFSPGSLTSTPQTTFRSPS